ncbi:MAG: prepilin-type N-terminal cleavage/methylation domain-containing protein [Rhodospirillales bacterium]|nr:prepilin-type N-terminal cleavage/methylation domain-containing protein [Rhodospirillales bacterium]
MNRQREAGLTLVELLVALAILALIATLISNAMAIGAAGTETVDRRAEWADELRLGQSTIRRHLAEARPVRWPDGRRSVIAFDGNADSVSFISVVPAWPGAAGLYLVRFQLVGGELVMTRRITAGESPEFAFDRHSERRVLATGVSTLRFAYFGTDDPRQPAGWSDRWHQRSRLPSLVSLNIAYADPAKGRWPTLTVAPVLDAQPR